MSNTIPSRVIDFFLTDWILWKAPPVGYRRHLRYQYRSGVVAKLRPTQAEWLLLTTGRGGFFEARSTLRPSRWANSSLLTGSGERWASVN